MTFNAAVKRLKKEQEFLGLSWEGLLAILGKSPMSFPNGAVDAYIEYTKQMEEDARLGDLS